MKMYRINVRPRRLAEREAVERFEADTREERGRTVLGKVVGDSTYDSRTGWLVQVVSFR